MGSVGWVMTVAKAELDSGGRSELTEWRGWWQGDPPDDYVAGQGQVTDAGRGNGMKGADLRGRM